MQLSFLRTSTRQRIFSVINMKLVQGLSVMVLALLMNFGVSDAKSAVDLWNHVGKPIMHHCKSADDDLGLLQLDPEHHYIFEFHMNFWQTTLFTCSFTWGTKHQEFIVWEVSRKFPVVCGRCAWKIDSWGFYYWDKHARKFFPYKPWLAEGCPVNCNTPSDEIQAPGGTSSDTKFMGPLEAADPL